MSAVQLRVFHEEWAEQDDDAQWRRTRDDAGRSDPRLLWTWPVFFGQWFRPQVLERKRRAEGTIDLYGNALRYWAAITGDVELWETDPGTWHGNDNHKHPDLVANDFAEGLEEWGFSRRGMRLGQKHRIGRLADCPAFSPLTPHTIAGHISRMATLFRAAGPRYDPRKKTAGILRSFAYLEPSPVESTTKPPFSIATARAIYAACPRMVKPPLPAGWPLALWWRLRIALLYYTGLRSGTVVSLRRRHLVSIDGQPWLDVPGSLVRKTGKPVKMPLHPHLALLLAQLPPGGSDELLLPEACCYRHFLTLHEELLALAGLDEALRQSPHAWRRTNLTELGTLGLARGMEVARVAGDHSDGRTTQSSYVGEAFVNLLRLQMPRLDAV